MSLCYKLLIMVTLSCALIPTYALAKSPAQNEREETCQTAGGKWREFPNGCADFCFNVRSKKAVMCTMALMPSCDCGPDECWNPQNEQCEPNTLEW